MHSARSICCWCALSVIVLAMVWTVPPLFAGDTSGDENGAPPEDVSESLPHKGEETVERHDDEVVRAGERVILRVNRNETVAGEVQLENSDVIVVRTRRGELRSFPRIRILQVIRLVEPEPGQHGVVHLRNGQRREGVIVEDEFDYVLVEIEGIPARLRREFVDYVVLEPTFQQRYEQFRETIRPNMFDRHLALCRWLIRHREYDLAKENLEEILAQKELHDARELLKLVNAQLALRRNSVSETPQPPQESGDPTPRRVPADLLTHEDVNLIRVYEIDFDNPPRLQVDPPTVRRLFESYGTHESVPSTQSERNAMIRGDASKIVRLMFELRARELYPEIQVNSEPHSLNQFRLRVHNTWLLNNCATSGCHGGQDAGDLLLHRRNHTDARVRYTNFMILENLEVDPEWPLINYDNPEMSLIIQYGMPRELARLPHPDVRGWRPVFSRPNDRMKRDAMAWIKSMMQPRPAYPIEFDPKPQWINGPEDAVSDITRSKDAASSDR